MCFAGWNVSWSDFLKGGVHCYKGSEDIYDRCPLKLCPSYLHVASYLGTLIRGGHILSCDVLIISTEIKGRSEMVINIIEMRL